MATVFLFESHSYFLKALGAPNVQAALQLGSADEDP